MGLKEEKEDELSSPSTTTGGTGTGTVGTGGATVAKSDISNTNTPPKKRNKKKKPNFEIIGLVDPSLILDYGGGTAATTLKQDFTTYPDKAIVQIQNATLSDIVLYGGAIRGKRVTKVSGSNGYIWEYSDYDSIERNGEQFEEIGNDYIVDPTQCKSVGDYNWKESRPHKVYVLTLQGCQYQYEIGDIYSLALTYRMATGDIENISTDVEITGVSYSRTATSLGSTEITCRVPSPAWALTTNTLARLVGAGAPNRLGNRSNVVTVASSTYTGQADYFCDGVDDDIELNLAMEYLRSSGGGILQLTKGEYNLTDDVRTRLIVYINGEGSSTIINSIGSAIVLDSNDSSISNVCVKGDGTGAGINGNSFRNSITNCIVDNFAIGISMASDGYISNCKVYNCTSGTGNAGIIFQNGNTIIGNLIYSCNSDGIRVSGSNNIISSCISHDNSVVGIHVVQASYENNLIVGNRAYSNGTNFTDNGTGTINSGNSFV